MVLTPKEARAPRDRFLPECEPYLLLPERPFIVWILVRTGATCMALRGGGGPNRGCAVGPTCAAPPRNVDARTPDRGKNVMPGEN